KGTRGLFAHRLLRRGGPSEAKVRESLVVRHRTLASLFAKPRGKPGQSDQSAKRNQELHVRLQFVMRPHTTERWRQPPVSDGSIFVRRCTYSGLRGKLPTAGALTSPCPTAHAATCARDPKCSFARTFFTCNAAVDSAITSSAAIRRFENPRAKRTTTSRS